jgi:folate-binding protein YgfZ
VTEVLDVEAGHRALRHGVAAVRLPRDVVRVRGTDAVAFLHGQLSQDVTALAVGDSAWAFLLAPQGRVDAWLRVTRVGDDELLLDLDPGFATPAVARLERFKLRTAADLEVVAGWSCLAVRGPETAGVVPDRTSASVVAPVEWPGGVVGLDLVGADPTVPVAVPLAPIEALDAVRIECGVPVLGRELTDATIPAEAGEWVIDRSVSFTKGCYTGQELVARVDSRGGHVPRPLRGVLIGEGAGPEHLPPRQSAVTRDGAEVGRLSSVAWSPGLGAAVALAAIARSVEPPSAVEVDWDGSARPARVVALPLVP